MKLGQIFGNSNVNDVEGTRESDMIEELEVEGKAEEIAKLLRNAFGTVAEDFNFTIEDAPTNPAFISEEELLKASANKRIRYFGYFCNSILVGCYALEQVDDTLFYLERLAVRPEERHKGIGRELVLHAFDFVKVMKGEKISIGIIDENRVLKEWYKSLGFELGEQKVFSHLPFSVRFMEYEL